MWIAWIVELECRSERDLNDAYVSSIMAACYRRSGGSRWLFAL